MKNATPKAATGLRILIVEDDSGFAASLALLLGDEGHQVEIAPSGSAGVAIAHEVRPDVVLLDIGLPGLSGYDVARQLRELPGKKPFIIAVTGYGEPSDRLDCAEAGIDLHFVKPVDLDILQGVVKRFKRTVHRRARPVLLTPPAAAAERSAAGQPPRPGPPNPAPARREG